MPVASPFGGHDSVWVHVRTEQCECRDADCSAHSGILAIAHFSQVHSSHDPQACSQPLQEQPDDGGSQEYPQELGEGGTTRQHGQVRVSSKRRTTL